MNEQTQYRDYLNASYERVISGKLTEEELTEEAIVLYKGGWRVMRKGTEVILWGDHIGEIDSMPHDCYCQLVKTPTHMAASILIYAWLHSESARNFEPLKEAITLGLLGAISGGFRGHGYDAENDFLINMRLYENVKAMEFCRKYSYICPEFTEEYVKRVESLKEIVDYEIWKKESEKRD